MKILPRGTIVKTQFAYDSNDPRTRVEVGELLTIKKMVPTSEGCEFFFEEKDIGYWFGKASLITSVDVVNIFEIAEALCES